MSIKKYFEEKTGKGVLATASKTGEVNTALYARPHVFDEKTLGFIMWEKLPRKNLKENAHASYLFHESGGAFNGVRLRLKTIDESSDHELISSLSRRQRQGGEANQEDSRFLVRFSVEKCFALVGGDEVKL
jgi:hypothetical protein